MPVQAGIQSDPGIWVPACAGTTTAMNSSTEHLSITRFRLRLKQRGARDCATDPREARPLRGGAQGGGPLKPSSPNLLGAAQDLVCYPRTIRKWSGRRRRFNIDIMKALAMLPFLKTPIARVGCNTTVAGKWLRA